MAYASQEAMTSMFKLIETMTDMGLPVIFKGGMVLRTFSATVGVASRMTRDLDMSWFQEDLTNESLLAAVRSAVHRTGMEGYEVTLVRKFSETRGAGIEVRKPGSSVVFFSLDVTVKDSYTGGESFYVQYPSLGRGTPFKGSSPNKMVADKIMAVSNRVVIRRTKDLFDLGVLSQVSGYNTHIIYTLMQQNSGSLGDFDVFLNQREGKTGLRHAYDLLKIDGVKPDFDTLMHQVTNFCAPFIEGIDLKTPLHWTMNQVGKAAWVRV